MLEILDIFGVACQTRYILGVQSKRWGRKKSEYPPSLGFGQDIEKYEKEKRKCLQLCSNEIAIDSPENRRKFTDCTETFKFVDDKYNTPVRVYLNSSPSPGTLFETQL